MKLVRDPGPLDPTDETAPDPHGAADAFDGAGPFPHDKLDAYRVALEMARSAKGLAEHIPRGHRSIADHLLRSSANTVLLLAEGANRRGAAEKRQRFVESRGETGEVAAACDLVMVLELGSESEARAAAVKRDAARVGAMLTRLIQRLS
jgi:four helix bundle protein